MTAAARWWAADRARAAETSADKRLYVEAGLTPLRCRACGTEVLVKKNSDKHTSVQWTGDPVASCPEFAEAAAAGRRSAELLGCGRLKESIAAAVEAGELTVPGAEP